MTKYKTVEGEIATVDVFANLTTVGPDTTGPVKVPANSSRISALFVAAGLHLETAGDNTSVVIRLSGDGLTDGPHDITVACGGTGVTATSAYTMPVTILPVNIGVKPNENINVAAVGTADFAVSSISVTLCFE
jgi:hypothetical protein